MRLLTVLAILRTARPADLPGDACLPRDVVNFIGSDLMLNAGKKCRAAAAAGDVCTSECRDALYELKGGRCYHALTQSQQLQPRGSDVRLSAMAGRWYGMYPANGIELLEVRYDATSQTLSGVKLSGNAFVPAGQTSWEATPVGCRVASSLYAGKFTERWDPCTLTMHGLDHMHIDLGAHDDGLHFVRARASLLLDWDEPNAATHGLGKAFELCEIEAEDAQTSLRSWAQQMLHHSAQAVVLDQLLVALPLLLLGGWFSLSADATHRPILFALGMCYLSVLSGRLAYLGLYA